MRRVKLTAFLALILLMSLSAVKSLCAETPWGRVPVYGYKDTIRKDNRKFAPYAILVEERNVTGLYLEYTYSRYNSHQRAWKVRMVDKHGNPTPSHGNLRITFPFPSIWSDEYQAYWKWTKAYAEQYDWSYNLVGYLLPTTHILNEDGLEIRFKNEFSSATVTVQFE